MTLTLTAGAVPLMYNGEAEYPVILQVVGITKVTADGAPTEKERFRLTVSDGTHSISVILGSQLNQLIHEGAIKEQTVVEIVHCLRSVVRGKPVIIAMTVEVVGEEKLIGVPEPFEKESAPAPAAPADGPAPAAAPAPGVLPTMSIGMLNPYISGWSITARVTSKGAIRTWNNARGSGKLFSVELLDREGGEIRATFFQDAADRYFDMIEENKVYTFSRGDVKYANRKFSVNIKNEYEINFGGNALVVAAQEDSQIKMHSLHLVALNMLKDLPKDSYVDVLGVLQTTGQIDTIRTRNDTDLEKRLVTIADSSSCQVDVTLWGEKATGFAAEEGAVVVVRGARVSEFRGGLQLGTVSSSEVLVNPDGVDEVDQLRRWWADAGATASLTNLSEPNTMGTTGSAAGAGTRGNQRKTSSEALAIPPPEEGERGGFIEFVGTITSMKKDSPWYPACGRERGGRPCQKKLNFEGGNWYCATCDDSVPKPTYRYILSVTAMDHTDQLYLTAFNEAAEALLGVTADEMYSWKEAQDPRYEQAFERALFRRRLFVCTVQRHMYEDNVKVKFQVFRSQELTMAKELDILSQDIAALQLKLAN